MLKIGDFSKLSRITIRMLRHYDEIDLLIPRQVDEFSGYRYYDEAQLAEAGQIQSLKNMGFSLSIIREIMESWENPDEMERFLTIRKKELESHLNETAERLHLLDNTMRWLRKDGNVMNYNVTLKTLPERYVASVRQIIPAYDEEGRLWKALYEEMAGMKMQEANPRYGMAIFHDEGYKEQDVDVEIQVAVSGQYKDTEHVKFKHAPSVQFASVTYKGGYDQFTKVNEAVANWIHSNGYEFDGKTFSIYHVSPSDTNNPQEMVTEVCHPVKKKS